MLFTLCSCSESGEKIDLNKDKASSQSSAESVESTQSSTEERHLIDLDAFEELEQRDTSKVKIIKKEFKYDTEMIVTNGNDSLYITIENNESLDVTAFEVYMIGYNNENCMQSVARSYTVGIGNNYKYVQSMNVTSETIKSGESVTVYTTADADNLSGVKMIVASYTTSDGKSHKNELVAEWLQAADHRSSKIID